MPMATAGAGGSAVEAPTLGEGEGEWQGRPACARVPLALGSGGEGDGAWRSAAARPSRAPGVPGAAPRDEGMGAAGWQCPCGAYGGARTGTGLCTGGGRSKSKMFHSGLRIILLNACMGLIPLRLHVPVNVDPLDDASAAAAQRMRLWASLSGWTTSRTARSTRVESNGIPSSRIAAKRAGMAFSMDFLAGNCSRA